MSAGTMLHSVAPMGTARLMENMQIFLGLAGAVGGVLAAVVSFLALRVAKQSARASDRASQRRHLEALRRLEEQGDVLRRLERRTEEQGQLHVGTNRKLKRLDHRSERLDHRQTTRVELHICENLGTGLVDIDAYPVGTAPVQVTRVEVLYRDGTSLAPRGVPTYPVRLDSARPPGYVEITGPWEKIGGVEPDVLLEKAQLRSGLLGLLVHFADGTEQSVRDEDVCRRMEKCAVKAMRRWMMLRA